MSRSTRRLRRVALVLVVMIMVSMIAAMLPAVARPMVPAGVPLPIAIDVTANDGSGTARTPGRTCADGGSGAYWHYDYGSALASGTLGTLPAELRAHLDLHSDIVRSANTSGGTPPAPATPSAFLQGSESHASLINDRGSVKVRLASGACDDPTLTFDGSVAAGAGTWVVDSGAGAYRSATGSGTFDLTAEVNPGADNALALSLDGAIEILAPTLETEIVGTYWGGLGIDYVTRRVTVVYEVTNVGPGDAFGVGLTGIGSPTSGVQALPGLTLPHLVGDLLTGQTATFSVRYQLGLLNPCALVVLGCKFNTELTYSVPDAFDRPSVVVHTNAAKAPLLPPPL